MTIKLLFRTIQQRPYRLISQSLLVATMSSLALMMGVIPRLSDQSLTPVFDTAAVAQEQFTNEELSKYAAAVLQIENLRVGVYREIQSEYQKQTPSGSVPPIICNQTSSVNTLPQNIQVIAVNYCDQAKKIIESNNLTVSQFNQITMTQKTDPALKEKIQAELIRIQQGGIQ